MVKHKNNTVNHDKKCAEEDAQKANARHVGGPDVL